MRNLRSQEGCQVVGICDQTSSRPQAHPGGHPGIPIHSDFQELVKSPEVDAVAVITPV